MRNLLYLIIRYSALLAFLILELVSFYLIINYNKSQKEIWAHSSNLLSGNLNKKVQNVEDFFTLQELNDSLFRENAKLLETIINYRISSDNNQFQAFENASQDSTSDYRLIPAKVCDKTLNLRNNYLTLYGGENKGIKVGMGVISDNGVVGIVKNTSKKFATVMLLLNSQSRISSMIYNKGYHGNLVWTSEDIREMKLLDVPKHSNVEIGDTVVTSGFSISFPKFINIGKVKAKKIVGGSNNFDILVDLDYDLGKVHNVYVVDFIHAEEKTEILTDQDE